MDKKCICHLRSIYRAITALEQEMQKLHGININEGMLLCLLSENKSLTSGEIAEALGLTCSNTSKIICLSRVLWERQTNAKCTSHYRQQAKNDLKK